MIETCCRKCSTPLPHDARFCSTCGTFNPSEDDQPDTPTSEFTLVPDATVLQMGGRDSTVISREDDKIFLFPTLSLEESEEQGGILLLPPVQTIESTPTRIEHQQPQNGQAAHEQPQGEQTSSQPPSSQYNAQFQPLPASPAHFQPGLVKKQQSIKFSKQFSRGVRIGALVTMLITIVLLLSYFSRSLAAPQQPISTPAAAETAVYNSPSLSTPGVGGTPKPGSTPQPAPNNKATPAPTSPSVSGSTSSCLNVDTPTLTFGATAGGGNPGSQLLTITNGNGCGAGAWSATSDSVWLTLDHTGGNIDANGSVHLHVSATQANLKAGTYTGHIQVNPGAKSVTVTLNVLQVSAPCITAKTTALNFTATVGGTAASQTVGIVNGLNCGPGTWSVASDANWLHVQGGGSIAAGGSASATVTVSPAGLAAGSYTGHLTLSANGSKPVIVSVTLTIKSSLCPQGTPQALNFTGDVGANKRNPAAQVVTVSNPCGRATVTAVAGAPWLTVTGGGAVDADGKIALSVRAICLNQNNVAILKPGTYTATVTITITASDGTQASATVPVSFVVMQ